MSIKNFFCKKDSDKNVYVIEYVDQFECWGLFNNSPHRDENGNKYYLAQDNVRLQGAAIVGGQGRVYVRPAPDPYTFRARGSEHANKKFQKWLANLEDCFRHFGVYMR